MTVENKKTTRNNRNNQFSFSIPKGKIDWQFIKKLNIDRMMHGVDLDALEMSLESIVYGSMKNIVTEPESPELLSKIFRICQMGVQYLLFVQDSLAAEVKTLKVLQRIALILLLLANNPT